MTPGALLVIDIGGTNIKIGYSLGGVPHRYNRLFSTEALRQGDPVDALVRMIAEVRAETGLAPDYLVATVPGFLDRDMDRVLFAGNVLTLNGRRLASELSAALSLPVLLERDSVLALMGETAAGACQGVDNVLGIYFGTGVGAAYLDHGVPFRGTGWALEIGHIPFRTQGRKLDGLKTDCLETYVSGRALSLIAGAHDTPIRRIFIAAAEQPETELGHSVADFIRDMAIAVALAETLFSAGTILLGGGVCEIADFPRERLAALIEEKAPFQQTGRRMDLRWAQLGWRSTLYGASLAVAARSGRAAA